MSRRGPRGVALLAVLALIAPRPAAAACTLRTIGPLRTIYVGASAQHLNLVADANADDCPGTSANGRELTLTGQRPVGTATPLRIAARGQWLGYSDVAGQRIYHVSLEPPSSSTAQTFLDSDHAAPTWSIAFPGQPDVTDDSGNAVASSISVEGVEIVRAELSVPSIHAFYRRARELGVAPGSTPEVDDAPVALADPTAPTVQEEQSGSRGWAPHGQVTNEAKLHGLPLDAIWRFLHAPEMDRLNIARNPEPGAAHHLFWCAQPATDGVRIVDEAGATQDQAVAAPIFAERIRFVAAEGRTSGVVRFHVWLTAGHLDDDVCDNTQLLSFRSVLVAAQIRRHSVPLPLDDALIVSCGARSSRHDNDVITPLNHTMSRCRIGLTPEMRRRLRRDSRDLGYLYGPQEIEVRVRKDGADSDWQVWRLDPERPRPFDLNIDGSIGDNEEYRIEARIQARPARVEYRSVGGSVTRANGDPSDGSHEFEARIRPRGTFGWDADIRIFVTVPLTPLAFRFPQASHRLTRSDEFVGAGMLPPRAGLLLALELWDYERRRSYSHPIPIRLVVGGYLLEASQQVVAPTFDAGISVAFPLLSQDSQLSSSVSLTALYEYDSIDGTSGLVLALSAELFTLFSGSTSTNEASADGE